MLSDNLRVATNIAKKLEHYRVCVENINASHAHSVELPKQKEKEYREGLQQAREWLVDALERDTEIDKLIPLEFRNKS